MAKKTIEKETNPVAETAQEDVSKNEALTAKPIEGKVISRPLTKKEIIKAKLDAQPKVRIIIPKEAKESEGSFETVQINGYTLQIRKGVYVEVPQQVADIIMSSNHQINQALETAARKLSDMERPEFNNSN
jgi:hypothetical protein